MNASYSTIQHSSELKQVIQEIKLNTIIINDYEPRFVGEKSDPNKAFFFFFFFFTRKLDNSNNNRNIKKQDVSIKYVQNDRSE